MAGKNHKQYSVIQYSVIQSNAARRIGIHCILGNHNITLPFVLPNLTGLYNSSYIMQPCGVGWNCNIVGESGVK